MTPADLRKRAADADAESLEAADDGDAAEAKRHLLRAHAYRELAAELERLSGASEVGTVGTMHVQPDRSRGAAISAGKAQNSRQWPLRKALTRRGLSVPEWARQTKRNVNVAKSWLKAPGSGGRPIPRAEADAIATEFAGSRGKSEVPAVNASWPCGIRED